MKRHVFLKNEDVSKKKVGMKQYLNKDIKEFNTVILSLLCIGFLVAVGIISYKVNTSYAIFTDSIEGEKVIEVAVSLPEEDFSIAYSVYSWNMDGVSIGNALESIGEYTTDYTTFTERYFLKHNIGNDNKVKRNDVCYTLNSNIYCLKGGSPDYYEENSAISLESIGEDKCNIHSDYVFCLNSSTLKTQVDNDGSVTAYDGFTLCSVDANGYAQCLSEW